MTAVARVRCERRGDLTLCAIAGEIDPTNVADVQKALLEAPARPGDRPASDASTGEENRSVRKLVVDFDELSFIDSAGIAMLFDVSRRLRHDGVRLALAMPLDSPVRRVLELVRIDSVAALASTHEAAIAALGDLA